MYKLALTPITGKRGTTSRLRDQLHRLFSTTIRCSYSESGDCHGSGLGRVCLSPPSCAGIGYTIAHKHQLWWSPPDPEQPPARRPRRADRPPGTQGAQGLTARPRRLLLAHLPDELPPKAVRYPLGGSTDPVRLPTTDGRGTSKGSSFGTYETFFTFTPAPAYPSSPPASCLGRRQLIYPEGRSPSDRSTSFHSSTSIPGGFSPCDGWRWPVTRMRVPGGSPESINSSSRSPPARISRSGGPGSRKAGKPSCSTSSPRALTVSSRALKPASRIAGAICVGSNPPPSSARTVPCPSSKSTAA
jgi:hypothetical protein